ncbi:hypothetical protein [Polaromonas sp. CG_9.11]|uniref:hypothetical protein n=1 Tax=Polaromonas sp. CG_9.11 TaxID=2787730 RepID=UPI0018CA4861|nr:hypothetical protein [Polaromonas sp. CG_9.11]
MTLAVAASFGCFGNSLVVAQTTPNSPQSETPSTDATKRDNPHGQARPDAKRSDAKARDTRAARTENHGIRKKADTEYQTATKRCLALKGAEERECLKRAKGSYAEAIAAANGRGPGVGTTAAPPGGPVPALQTQSSAVSATGIAPSTIGADGTPGTQAAPAK